MPHMTTQCWVWVGYRDSNGYGRFRASSETVLAHRFGYELRNGPIPEGMKLLHLCDNPACVRSDHLMTGTQADNVRDMIEKGRRRNNIKVSFQSKPTRGLKSVNERFWEKVQKSNSPDGCWIWIGARFSNGYGHIGINKKSCLAHRVAWELERGPIPDGLVLRHKCDTPACVRVSHLLLGTHSDNSQDMVNRNRQTILTGEKHPGFGVYREFCAKGHPMTPDNVIITGDARRCLICYRASNRAGALRYARRHRDEINKKRQRQRDEARVGPAIGERHGNAKLTDVKVMQIRTMYASGDITQEQLANKFGVSESLIGQVVNRKIWKHIDH